MALTHIAAEAPKIANNVTSGHIDEQERESKTDSAVAKWDVHTKYLCILYRDYFYSFFNVRKKRGII